MTERELELRVERLEVQVEGLIGSLHTLVESLAVAIGRDDVVPASKKFAGLWTAEDVAQFIGPHDDRGHVLGDRGFRERD